MTTRRTRGRNLPAGHYVPYREAIEARMQRLLPGYRQRDCAHACAVTDDPCDPRRRLRCELDDAAADVQTSSPQFDKWLAETHEELRPVDDPLYDTPQEKAA